MAKRLWKMGKGRSSAGFTFGGGKMNKKTREFAKKLSHEVMARYDAFLATQLTLIAREKGVSVSDLCLAHDEITAVYQPKDGVVRYWIELKPKGDLCTK